jgi:zinc protease
MRSLSLLGTVLIIFSLPIVSLSQEQVKITKLTNGMTLMTMEDHSTPLVAMQMTYHVGSKNEPIGLSGITKICEKMMLEGTTRYEKGEFERIIQSGGGKSSSEADLDFTRFTAKIPSSMLDTLLFLEADRLQNIELTYEKLILVKEILKKERLTYVESSLYGPLNEEIMNLTFRAHPYRNPVFGWPSDLNNITLDNLRDYFRQYFQPANAELVLVGDFSTAAVVARVKELFEKILSTPVPSLPKVIEPEQRGERREMMYISSSIPVVFIGYHISAAADSDIAALKVIRHILAGSESAYLYKKLVIDSKMALSAGGELIESEDPGLLILYSVLNYGTQGDLALEQMLVEIERLKAEPLSTAELEMAKNKIEAAYYNLTATYDQIAGRISFYQMATGDYRLMNQEIPLTRAVTSGKVMQIAQKYLTETGRNVIILVPAKTEESEKNSGEVQ